MKKQLITVNNLNEFVSGDKFYLDSSIILTPGAKDELARRKISIVYGSPADCSTGDCCPPGCTCPKCMAALLSNPALENMLISVAALLKNEYGVTDPEQLKALSLQALQTIKENI